MRRSKLQRVPATRGSSLAAEAKRFDGGWVKATIAEAADEGGGNANDGDIDASGASEDDMGDAASDISG